MVLRLSFLRKTLHDTEEYETVSEFTFSIYALKNSSLLDRSSFWFCVFLGSDHKYSDYERRAGILKIKDTVQA